MCRFWEFQVWHWINCTKVLSLLKKSKQLQAKNWADS
jgi:hypothetical protein